MNSQGMVDVAGSTNDKQTQPRLLFRDNQKELRKIFAVLNAGSMPLTLESIVDSTQPWAMGDHSRPAYDFSNLSEYQVGALQEVFNSLDMVSEHIVSGEEVDDLLFCAAIFAGALRRSELVARMVNIENLSPKRIMILSGERRLYPEVETDDIHKTIQELRLIGVDDTLVEQLVQGDVNVNSLWETDLMRLAALRHMGQLTLQKTVFRQNDERSESPKLHYMEFDWQGVPVILNHTLAVPRKMGEARSTTEASIQDWLYDHTPRSNAKTVLVGAQPHIQRMELATRRTVSSLGRHDIEIIPAASRVGSIKTSMYLGEIARWLWEEQECQRSS